MVQSEIMDGNRIIAEFMDRDIRPGKLVFDYDYLVNCFYHSSWDWLMDVVDRITKVCDKDKRLHDWFNDAPVSDIRIFRETKEDTWLSVIEFIKYYNTTKS